MNKLFHEFCTVTNFATCCLSISGFVTGPRVSVYSKLEISCSLLWYNIFFIEPDDLSLEFPLYFWTTENKEYSSFWYCLAFILFGSFFLSLQLHIAPSCIWYISFSANAGNSLRLHVATSEETIQMEGMWYLHCVSGYMFTHALF